MNNPILFGKGGIGSVAKVGYYIKDVPIFLMIYLSTMIDTNIIIDMVIHVKCIFH